MSHDCPSDGKFAFDHVSFASLSPSEGVGEPTVAEKLLVKTKGLFKASVCFVLPGLL